MLFDSFVYHWVMAPRFLSIADVAETLNVSVAQVRGLISSQDLPAIQVGAGGHWRIETTKLDEYIERQYQRASEKLSAGN